MKLPHSNHPHTNNMYGYKRGKGRERKGVRDKGKERKREENGREMFISFVWFLREEKRKERTAFQVYSLVQHACVFKK